MSHRAKTLAPNGTHPNLATLIVSVLVIACTMFAGTTGSAFATQTQVDLTNYTNGNVTTFEMVNFGLPTAGSSYTINGIAFTASSHPSSDNTMGVFATSSNLSVTIAVDIAKPTAVYTVANSLWGQITGTDNGKIIFKDAAGDRATFFYQEGVNLRDYFYNVYTNTVTDVYGSLITNGGGYRSSNRLDAQQFVLPSAFEASTLTSITFEGVNLVNHGQPDGAPILEAVTVVSSGVRTKGWSPTGSMTTPRIFHAAARLPDGKVLVAGGHTGSPVSLSSAEIYDPATGLWRATGSMAAPRAGPTLTLLPNGKVLAAGGFDGNNALCSAELYDPATGAWAPTGAMHDCRDAHNAVLLTNGPLSGHVLVAGGQPGGSQTPPFKSAELYDPKTGQWSQTGSMQIAGYFDNQQNLVALNDGSAFVVGGATCCPYTWRNSAETFSPQTGTWTPAPGKKTHAQGAAALMKDGRVLVAGGVEGQQPTNKDTADAEIFDPTSRTWKATPQLPNGREGHALTVRENGRVLLSGGASVGLGYDDSPPQSCRRMGVLYFPQQVGWGYFSRTLMDHARVYHTATLLSDGSVLATGGIDCEGNVLSSAEIYRPVVVAFAGLPGHADCVNESVSALTRQYPGLDAAAADLEYPDAKALDDAILEHCQ
jgi:hypothetical protein